MRGIEMSMSSRITFQALAIAVVSSLLGCSHPPGGSILQPQMLGSQTDEIFQLQEQNAELAKLHIYTHEFEINLQPELRADKSKDTFNYLPEIRPHGLRLTPAGEDHVQRIAQFLRSDQHLGPDQYVVVERSETSKRWATKHKYPVHRNHELDEMRRTVVITALSSLGIPNANDLVVIAPAYPTGLSVAEAAQAYQNSRNSGGNIR